MKKNEKYDLQNEAYRAGWEDANGKSYSDLKRQAEAWIQSEWSQADLMSAVAEMLAYAIQNTYTPDLDEDRLS